MTTDPRDAEIARLRMALAESEAAAEGALMILVQTQAERDAKAKWLGELLAVIHRDGGNYQDRHGDEKAVRDAHLIVAGLFSKREVLVAGAYEAAANLCKTPEWRPYFEPHWMGAKLAASILAHMPGDALAALLRRDAQMRAEGMRKAACIKKTPEFGSDWLGMSCAILAAAEKEAGNG